MGRRVLLCEDTNTEARGGSRYSQSSGSPGSYRYGEAGGGTRPEYPGKNAKALEASQLNVLLIIEFRL